MFDRLKNCPGCARRRARLVAMAKVVVDAFPTFTAPAVEYRPGLIEKARDQFALEEALRNTHEVVLEVPPDMEDGSWLDPKPGRIYAVPRDLEKEDRVVAMPNQRLARWSGPELAQPGKPFQELADQFAGTTFHRSEGVPKNARAWVVLAPQYARHLRRLGELAREEAFHLRVDAGETSNRALADRRWKKADRLEAFAHRCRARALELLKGSNHV